MKRLIILGRQIWALRPFIYIFMVLVLIVWALSRASSPLPTTSTMVQTAPAIIPSTPDYENDISERSKDWVYYRNRAYKLGREGDKQGAAEAGAIMNRYYNDLRKRFSEKEITEAIAQAESGK
jgi:hypothetical protein